MDILTKAALIVFGTVNTLLPGVMPEPAPTELQKKPKSIHELRGKQIPAFEMTTVDGKKVTNASLKGKTVIIDFWASWCGPCRKASPVMDALQKKHKKDGLVVVVADVLEAKKGPAAAQKYLKEHKYSFTMTYDADKIHSAWGAMGVPTILLIDKSGVVKFTADEFNEKTEAALKSSLASALKRR